MYDDTKKHKLTGSDRLSDESLKIIARCILFLHSDREFEWPYFDTNNPLFKFSFKEVAVSILTLGQYYRNRKKEEELSYNEFKKLGNFDIWPFIKQVDYAIKMHFFLNGQKAVIN